LESEQLREERCDRVPEIVAGIGRAQRESPFRADHILRGFFVGVSEDADRRISSSAAPMLPVVPPVGERIDDDICGPENPLPNTRTTGFAQFRGRISTPRT
jgi:hypothetical protein